MIGGGWNPLDALRRCGTDEAKQAFLQKHLGSRVEPDNKDELQRRAVLMTRLREEKLWPPGTS